MLGPTPSCLKDSLESLFRFRIDFLVLRRLFRFVFRTVDDLTSANWPFTATSVDVKAGPSPAPSSITSSSSVFFLSSSSTTIEGKRTAFGVDSSAILPTTYGHPDDYSVCIVTVET